MNTFIKGLMLAIPFIANVATGKSINMRSSSCSQDFYHTVQTCAGTPYSFDGNLLWGDGEYTATFTDAQGCDSVVHLTLWLMPTSLTEINYPLCQGDALNMNGVVIAAPGTYEIKYTASWGCDSTVVLHVYTKAQEHSSFAKKICGTDSFYFANQWLKSSGIYQETFTGVNGCDSVVTLNLSVVKFVEEIYADGDRLFTVAVADNYQWLYCPSYFAIPGANKAEYKSTLTGSFAIRMEKEGCIDTTTCFFKGNPSTGIEEAAAPLVQVYPNPAHGRVNLSFAQASQTTLELFDAKGQLVDVQRIDPNLTWQYDIQDRRPGFYLLVVRQGDRISKERLIIQ